MAVFLAGAGELDFAVKIMTTDRLENIELSRHIVRNRIDGRIERYMIT